MYSIQKGCLTNREAPHNHTLEIIDQGKSNAQR